MTTFALLDSLPLAADPTVQRHLSIAMDYIFEKNLALGLFLGMCTFLAVSKNVKTAIGLGIAVILIQTITVPANNLIYNGLLRKDALFNLTGMSAFE